MICFVSEYPKKTSQFWNKRTRMIVLFLGKR